MVTDGILWLLNRFVIGFTATIDGFYSEVPAPPNWLDDVASVLALLFRGASEMGAWVPVQFAVGVISTVMLVKLIAVVVHVARIVASFATLGGGAT